MFKSKQRPIVIPQSEHQKLAGTLALIWGNSDFDTPPVPFESFVIGVGLHDRAYGRLDNLPIGEIAEEAWIEITRAGFATTWTDQIADLITKQHLQRLMSYGDSPLRRAAAAEMAAAIHEQAQRCGMDPAILARIDRITNLCDRIAFDFSFEAPAHGEVAIFPKNDHADTLHVRYELQNGVIRVDPWPFAVDTYTGYLIGYRLDGYPAVQEPVILPYRLVGRHESRLVSG